MSQTKAYHIVREWSAHRKPDELTDALGNLVARVAAALEQERALGDRLREALVRAGLEEAVKISWEYSAFGRDIAVEIQSVANDDSRVAEIVTATKEKR